MKKLVLFAAVIVAVSFASCKKAATATECTEAPEATTTECTEAPVAEEGTEEAPIEIVEETVAE